MQAKASPATDAPAADVPATDVAWLAPKAAAKVIGCSEQSIHRWIKQGTIPALRFGPRSTKVAVPRVLAERAA